MARQASAERRIARNRRSTRVRRSVAGSDSRPRISVFRSNRHLYVQAISDESGRTLAAASSIKDGKNVTVSDAAALGKAIGEKLTGLGISTVIFDRNGYRYHGRVKALADAAREAGLKF